MIIGLFPGLAALGGVQVAGRQTAAALTAIGRERGWRCVFLSLNDATGEDEVRVGETRFGFTGFARGKTRFILKALWLAREKPRIIFAAHPNLAPIAAMMKAISGDTQTIVAAHGVEVWQPLTAIRRKTLRRASIITAPSTDTARRLTEIQGVSQEKIRRLPWPLDPEFSEFTKCADKLPRPKGFPPGQVVLAVGRWAANERYKGADLLIQAVVELSHDFSKLQLVLVGSGDDLVRLKEQARNSGAAERVQFLTDLSRMGLAACYAGADIFALPSTGEGFGLVFLEAMAFGKPVIGTNLGGIPDVVENGREGLLVEPTATAVSAALRRLLADGRLREELGAQGRRRVNTEFTFENFQRRLTSILDEATGKTWELNETR